MFWKLTLWLFLINATKQKHFDWQKPVKPITVCFAHQSLCQSECCTKLSLQHTLIIDERAGMTGGTANLLMHSYSLLLSLSLSLHTHKCSFSHNYAAVCTHVYMHTAGNGKQSLIGVIIRCLLFGSFQYPVHPDFQHFNQSGLDLEFPFLTEFQGQYLEKNWLLYSTQGHLLVHQ